MRAAAALLFAVLAAAPLAGATEDKTLGSGVTLQATTPLAEVIAHPGAFAGQTIRVEGVVTAVCEHMGCWMTLAPAGHGAATATLRLKVEDGVIVFPVSAKGRTAVAQGVLTAVAAADHHAGEAGAPAAAPSYQLDVTGAVLR